MVDFISAKEAAEKWNVSQGRVSALGGEQEIDSAMMNGAMRLVPSTAENPAGRRRTERREKQHAASVKPFVKWVGGKGQLLGELEKLLPASDENGLTKYCEPMVGGGALFFNVLTKCSFEEWYISDSNAELINAYHVIKSNAEELIAELNKMQARFLPMDEDGRKAYYYSIRDAFNTVQLCGAAAIQKAAHFIFLNKTCFNGLYRVNRKGQFNVPMGAYKKPLICDEENVRNISNVLQNVTIVCGDYSLAKQFIDKNTFVYLDPPYRPLSETSAFTSYNSAAFDDNEQMRLARFIDDINANGARIVLSNSDPKNVNAEDTFFDELYKNYKISRVEASRAINSKGNGRGKINELIICN